MILMIVGLLASIVLLGTATIIGGMHYFSLPPKLLTIAFAITAASWLAFLIAAIGSVVILLSHSSA